MSYCWFENALRDLLDCQQAILNDEELSQSEQKAKARLVRTCLKIVFDVYPDSDDNPLNYTEGSADVI
jgi:hypothetical protein